MNATGSPRVAEESRFQLQRDRMLRAAAHCFNQKGYSGTSLKDVADRLGLTDRGRIEVGAIADIAVLDPATVIDNATFDKPHQYAEGTHHVLVSGEAVLLNKEMTSRRPGQVLRSKSYTQ